MKITGNQEMLPDFGSCSDMDLPVNRSADACPDIRMMTAQRGVFDADVHTVAPTDTHGLTVDLEDLPPHLFVQYGKFRISHRFTTK